MSESTLATPVVPPTIPDILSALPESWDPFQLMDRLDEEALGREMEGIPGSHLVYVVKEGGQEITGLSKDGVDACCLALVSQGQVIREDDLAYELLGEGEDREALFKARASRYAVSADGTEVKLDQVLGVKRQPLYYEGQQLTVDSRVPSKRYRGKTYRDLLASDEGRDYLGWMAGNFNEPDIRNFVSALLQGETPAVQQGRRLNPHWYEHGAMKATRNARFRLIPAAVRAQIIAQARQEGQARVVESAAATRVRQTDTTAPARQDTIEPLCRETEERQAARDLPRKPQEQRVAPVTDAPAPAAGPEVAQRVGTYAPTEKQVAFYRRLVDDVVFTEEERRSALDWLATKATRQAIKDQIDWFKRQVGTRRARVRSAA